MSTMNRRKMVGGAVAMTVAAAASKVAAADPKKSTPSASATPGSSPSAGAAIEVKMLDTLKFEPAEIKAKPGDKIKFINKGVMQHDAKSDDAAIGEMVKLVDPGKDAEYTVPAKAEKGKTYEFHCTVAGHKEGGMVGKLIIQ